MSNLNLAAKDIIQVVKNKLQLRNLKTTRETYGDFYHQGRFLFRVKMPNEHGAGTSVSPGLLKACRETVFLSSKEYADLVRCPMTSDMYVQILTQKGIIRS